jgi:hypothetical protein
MCVHAIANGLARAHHGRTRINRSRGHPRPKKGKRALKAGCEHDEVRMRYSESNTEGSYDVIGICTCGILLTGLRGRIAVGQGLIDGVCMSVGGYAPRTRVTLG